KLRVGTRAAARISCHARSASKDRLPPSVGSQTASNRARAGMVAGRVPLGRGGGVDVAAPYRTVRVSARGAPKTPSLSLAWANSVYVPEVRPNVLGAKLSVQTPEPGLGWVA